VKIKIFIICIFAISFSSFAQQPIFDKRNPNTTPADFDPYSEFGNLWSNLFSMFDHGFDFYRKEVPQEFLDSKIDAQLRKLDREGHSLNEDIQHYLKENTQVHYLNSYADEYAILLENILKYPKNEEEYKDELNRLSTIEIELKAMHRSLKKNLERKSKGGFPGECGEQNIAELKSYKKMNDKFERLKTRVQNECQMRILNEMYPSFENQDEIIEAALKVRFVYSQDIFLQLLKSHVGWKIPVYDSAIYVNTELKKNVFMSLANSAYLRDWPSEAYVSATHIEHDYQAKRFEKIIQNTGILNWKGVVFQAAIHTPKNPKEGGPDLFMKIIEKGKSVDWPLSAYIAASKLQSHASFEAFEYLIDHGHFARKSISYNFQKIWESYLLETIFVLRDNIPGFLNLPSDILEGLKKGHKGFKASTKQAGVKGLNVVATDEKKDKKKEAETSTHASLFEQAPIAINLVNAFVFTKWTLGLVTPYVSAGLAKIYEGTSSIVQVFDFSNITIDMLGQGLPIPVPQAAAEISSLAASIGSAAVVIIIMSLTDSLSSYFGSSTSADTAFATSTKIGEFSLPLYKEMVDRAAYFDWPIAVYGAVTKADSIDSARRFKFLLDHTGILTNQISNTYNSHAFEVAVSKNMSKLDRLKRVSLSAGETFGGRESSRISFAEEALRKLIQYYPKRWRDWPASAYDATAFVDNQLKREAFEDLILLSLNYFFSDAEFWSPAILNSLSSIDNNFAKHAFLALVESKLSDASGFAEIKDVNSELKLQEFFMRKNINSRNVVSCHSDYRAAIKRFLSEHGVPAPLSEWPKEVVNASHEIKNESACYLFQNLLLRVISLPDSMHKIAYTPIARIENRVAADLLVSLFVDKKIDFLAIIQPEPLEKISQLNTNSLSIDLLKKVIDNSANGTLSHATRVVLAVLKINGVSAKTVFERVLNEADSSTIEKLDLDSLAYIQLPEVAREKLEEIFGPDAESK